MNNRDDFLNQVAEYLGIPERNANILDGMRSVEIIKANSDIIEDVDIPELDYTVETFETFFDESGNFVNDIINPRLDTEASQILSEYTFGTSGAIAMKTDANNGLWLSPSGILGKKAGVTTFAINNSGDATFKGEILSGSVVSATIAATNIVAGTFGSAMNVGDANVKIDGANKRILINDGTNDRILIGYLAGKF